MKFYNPLKPHIIEFENGTFAIRESIGSKYYLDLREILKESSKERWWSIEAYVSIYCVTSNIADAREGLLKYNKLKVPKFKVKKVIT